MMYNLGHLFACHPGPVILGLLMNRGVSDDMCFSIFDLLKMTSSISLISNHATSLQWSILYLKKKDCTYFCVWGVNHYCNAVLGIWFGFCYKKVICIHLISFLHFLQQLLGGGVSRLCSWQPYRGISWCILVVGWCFFCLWSGSHIHVLSISLLDV